MCEWRPWISSSLLIPVVLSEYTKNKALSVPSSFTFFSFLVSMRPLSPFCILFFKWWSTLNIVCLLFRVQCAVLHNLILSHYTSTDALIWNIALVLRRQNTLDVLHYYHYTATNEPHHTVLVVLSTSTCVCLLKAVTVVAVADVCWRLCGVCCGVCYMKYCCIHVVALGNALAAA